MTTRSPDTRGFAGGLIEPVPGSAARCADSDPDDSGSGADAVRGPVVFHDGCVVGLCAVVPGPIVVDTAGDMWSGVLSPSRHLNEPLARP